MSDRSGMDIALPSDIRDVKTAAVILRPRLSAFKVESPELSETVRVAIHSPEFCVSVSRRDRSWSALDAP